MIVLIPNSNHAQRVKDYRSISYCNIVYKVIAKVLAGCIAPVLKDIIDSIYTAFLNGHNITDNIHRAQELLRKYNHKWILPRYMIKVNLKKIYDSISWDFLEVVLFDIGFETKFIGWIM